MISLAEALYIASKKQGYVRLIVDDLYSDVLIDDYFDLEEIADEVKDTMLQE